ncbi:hypothetical protein DTL42_03770 [Bremerella cremea]|uniref:PpiC domain-containing protein n=1 Tax=Bremerella cremea TaxID=1031537 RepID=A0A368KV15_9BACT|nr:hypothetical protein [Bremerella cremea]RCS54273.1 hypothetical protein DTL42_03770 [Bremerella cremea]
MATPFKVFRDNQKILMVVFGALLMVAFIILPPVLQFGFSNRQAELDEGEVVVTVGQEELRADQVRALADKYNLVAQVITAAMQQSLQLQGTPNDPMPPIPGVQIQQPTQQSPGGPSFQKVTAEQAVFFHAWGKKADEMGLVVDDEAVREFLKETSGGRLSDYDYQALLGFLIGKQNPLITYDYFFEQLRDVLKAQKLQALMIRNSRVATPSSAWVAYRNMNRTISAEMFPIAASNFASKVGKPSESQIKELFEKYRQQPNNPAANQIGFRQMDKIALAYIKGDITNFVEAAKSQITDEEVAAHYEANKDSYRKLELPSANPLQPATTEEAAPMETTEAPAEGEQPAAETKPMEEAKPEPMAETPKAEEPKTEEPMAETPAAEKPAGEQPMPEAPKADEAKPEEPKAEEPKKEDSSFNQASSSNVQLVSYLQEEGADPKPEQPAEPAKENAAAPAEPMNEAAPATETEPAKPAQPATETEPATAPAAETTPPAAAPVQYKPLAEVQDEIRTRLAQPIAQKAMSEALSEMRGELQLQFENYRYAQSDENFDKTKSPYDSNAIETMATKLGLTFGAMPLVDIYEASETTFAQESQHVEYVLDPASGFRQVNRSLVGEAFQFGTPLFLPRLFPGAPQDQRFQREAEVQYIYWKTEEKEGFVPTLDDVREQVIQAWKELEAQKLAKEEAEQIAKLVKSKEGLVEAAKTHNAGDPIVAENITYFNQLPGQQQLTLGEISGVPSEEISQAMMDALFGTAVGESTVAPNMKENVYYVALITSEAETTAELRDNFMAGIQGALPDSVIRETNSEVQVVTTIIWQDYFDPSEIEWKVDPVGINRGM